MTGFTFPEDFSIEGLKTFLGAMNTVAASMAGVAICDKFAQIAGDEGSMEKFETDGKAFFKAIKAIAPEMTGFTFPEEFSVEGLKTLLTSLNEVALSMAGVSLSDLFSKLAGDAGTMEKFEADGKAFFGAIKAISTEAAGFKLPEGFSTQSFIDFIGCLVAISFTSVGTSLVDAFNKFIGKKGTIEKFQTDGVNLMRAIKAISDETEGLSTDGLTVADTALTKIKKLIEDVNGIDYSGVSAFTGVVVGGFGAAISFNGPVHNLGLAMKDYSNQVKDIDIDAVKVSVDAAIKLKNLISDLVELNTNGVESFKTAVESLANVQIGNITATFSSAIDGLRGIGENFETAMASGMKSKEKVLMGAATMQVQNLMDTFTKGIEQKRNSVVGAMTSSLPDAVSSIRNYYGSFASAGRYLADGFANGIGENAYKAAKEVQSMALQAKKAMEETLKIHSPSRVFYQEGDYTGMGFVNALHDYGSKAYDASASMANYARDGLNNAIKQIGMDLNGDLDSQPTIRPVLDLTDVQNGAARIGGLFGSGVSIDTMANLQSINTMMSDRNQNGTNADVISAINKLGSSLSNGRGGDSYVINGMTYDDGSNIASAMKEIVREARLERRR